MGAPQIQSKNLSILEDQMNYESLAYKKAEFCSQSLSDAALKNVARNIAQHHKQRFDRLFQYLNSHQ